MEKQKLPTVEPMFRDVVDYNKDPGEPWPIGRRRSTVKKMAKAQGVKHLKQVKVEKQEEQFVIVSVVLRRMPQEVQQELRELFISRRQVKDRMGNMREEDYWEPDKLNKMAMEKWLWMWLDTENFYVEVGDDAAADMYRKAYTSNGDKAPETLKAGSMHCIDSHVNEDIKRHLLGRFAEISQQIASAANKYDEVEKVHEDALRKNSESG